MTIRRFRNDTAPWLGDFDTPEQAMATMRRDVFMPALHVTVVLDYGRAEVPFLNWEYTNRLQRWFRRW